MRMRMIAACRFTLKLILYEKSMAWYGMALKMRLLPSFPPSFPSLMTFFIWRFGKEVHKLEVWI